MIARHPRKGDVIECKTINGEKHFEVVTHCGPNICHTRKKNGDDNSFIWKFHDGKMNSMHTIVR